MTIDIKIKQSYSGTANITMSYHLDICYTGEPHNETGINKQGTACSSVLYK